MRNGVECVPHNSIGLQFVQHVVKVITLLFYDVLFLPKKNYVGGGGGMAETLKLGNPTEHSSTNRRSFVMSSV